MIRILKIASLFYRQTADITIGHQGSTTRQNPGVSDYDFNNRIDSGSISTTDSESIIYQQILVIPMAAKFRKSRL
jgi:hypothetical protein